MEELTEYYKYDQMAVDATRSHPPMSPSAGPPQYSPGQPTHKRTRSGTTEPTSSSPSRKPRKSKRLRRKSGPDPDEQLSSDLTQPSSSSEGEPLKSHQNRQEARKKSPKSPEDETVGDDGESEPPHSEHDTGE